MYYKSITLKVKFYNHIISHLNLFIEGDIF